MNFRFKNQLIALALIFAGNASANLVNNGNGLIYDTVTNITFTQDANLLGTMESSNSNLVNTIINTITVVNDSNGTHQLTVNDFNAHSNGTIDAAFAGTTTWFGAQAFVGYLNNISYDGSNHWSLPTSDTCTGLGCANSQLGELWYNELGGVANDTLNITHNSNYNLFNNLMPAIADPQISLGTFWTSTEVSTYNPAYAAVFSFDNYNGNQVISSKGGNNKYAWVVTVGNLTAVPVPAAVWLFGSALAGLIGFNRRKSV